jgi:hypothetical protein
MLGAAGRKGEPIQTFFGWASAINRYPQLSLKT